MRPFLNPGLIATSWGTEEYSGTNWSMTNESVEFNLRIVKLCPGIFKRIQVYDVFEYIDWRLELAQYGV